MNLKQSIEETLSALNRSRLAETRLLKLHHEQAVLEERISKIEEESAYLSKIIEENINITTIEEVKNDYLFLIKKHRELSEQLGMLVFEKEILKDKSVDTAQLKLKLNALLNIRATQLETLPKALQEKIEQLNQRLDAIFVIKAELDQIIQFAYKLQVRFSDIQQKVDRIIFSIDLQPSQRKQLRKNIWEINHQLAVTYRQVADFEDNIEQINRLQTQHKVSSTLNRELKRFLETSLNAKSLNELELDDLSNQISRSVSQLDALIEGFKRERRSKVNQIKSLEHQRTEILIKK